MIFHLDFCHQAYCFELCEVQFIFEIVCCETEQGGTICTVFFDTLGRFSKTVYVCVCMYVCMSSACMYVICMHVCMYVCMCSFYEISNISMCVLMYAYMYLFGYVCIFLHMHVYQKNNMNRHMFPNEPRVYVCVCVSICVCVYMYIYIYIYTHTHTLNSFLLRERR